MSINDAILMWLFLIILSVAFTAYHIGELDPVVERLSFGDFMAISFFYAFMYGVLIFVAHTLAN